MPQPTTSATSPNAAANSPAASSSGSGSIADAASSKLGKQDFLQLLVAQLRNQNPRSPMKGREFATQLAQFSSVEQLTNISDQIGQQQGSDQALRRLFNSRMGTDLIGRTVEANGNQFTWTGEGERTLGMELSAPASQVTVTVRDVAGNAVHERTLQNVGAGTKEITWDGTTTDGSQLPEGSYSFEVEATDAQGESVGATPYIQGTVDRVSFGQEGTTLWVDGTKLTMDGLRSVAAS